MTPEWFPGVDVRQMHLDIRNAHCGKRVTQRHTRMGQPRGVDDDPGHMLPLGLMYALDQGPFMVALENLQNRSPPPSRAAQPLVDACDAFGPIDLRLAAPQQVQIGAVKQKNALRPSRGGTRASSRFGHDQKFAADAGKLYSIYRISQHEEGVVLPAIRVCLGGRRAPAS